MAEKSLDLRDHFPKAIRHLGRAEFDLVVNMSGAALPADPGCPVRVWDVSDPSGAGYRRHCEVRDQIERLVMELVLEARREVQEPHFRSLHGGH
jgi:protein-tyrosine-phosphatase